MQANLTEEEPTPLRKALRLLNLVQPRLHIVRLCAEHTDLFAQSSSAAPPRAASASPCHLPALVVTQLHIGLVRN